MKIALRPFCVAVALALMPLSALAQSEAAPRPLLTV